MYMISVQDPDNSGDPNNQETSYYEPRISSATFESFGISYSEAGNEAYCGADYGSTT